MTRRRFKGISHSAFSSEADRNALAALEKIPLLPQVVGKFYEMGLDRWLYCWNMAVSVRCGPKQYGTLYSIMQECSQILDMPEPELYITSHPYPNAFANGVERPYITLHSAIVDTLTDEELYHLMGHELAHIKSGHILYFTIARILIPLIEMVGRRTFGVGDALGIGLVMAFLEWSRQAELSCDRGGLLCSQDLGLSIQANLHMCGGPSRLSHEANPDAFLDQARTYQDIGGLDALGKVVVMYLYGMRSTHPMPVHRTQALEKWSLSGEYDKILNGHYQRQEGRL